VRGLDLSHLDRLLGDVVLEGEIARTAQAAVFRISSSRAHGGGASLALKVGLVPSSTEDLARFRHEVRLLSETRHPNVVEVYDFGVLPGDFPFFTMELLSGESVAERLRTAGWEVFYDAAIQAAAGLAHIHRQGIVHMDIKPANLGLGLGLGLATAPGKLGIKILDFGLAQEAHGLLDRRIRGTLAYTAPEVLLQDSYDHRADLYSLGITLFELATGVLPSAGDARDDAAAIRFHLEGTPPDPLALRPDLPPELARILLRLLQRDPGERYASAGRLLLDLAAAAGRSLDIAALSSSEGQVLASRLVGRDEILGRLRGELAAAAAGRGGAVLLAGREGAGKSRLLRELRLLAALDGARVGRAGAKSIAKPDTTEPAQPLAPFLEALAGLGIEVRPAEQQAGESGKRARYRLYREIALDLAAHAATGPPIVLLLDDLHLAGPESEELLTYLGEELRGFRALVVATRRTAETAANPEDDGPVLRLDLDPLDRTATARLVDACLGTSHLPAGFYAWMAEETHGLPGDIQRVLRHLIVDRVLLYRDGEWKPSLPGLSRWTQAPGGRAEQEWQRILALPPAARKILDAAAILAEPFSLDLLAAILDADPQAVYEQLSLLVTQGYCERLREAEGAVYLIAQRRIQQALCQALDEEPDSARRMGLHRRAGELLEERLRGGEGGKAAGRAAAIAEHFWRAGERARSLPYLLRAAGQATRVYGYAQAAALYGRAAEATAETEPAAGIQALAAQAESLAGAGSYARALRVYHDLLRRPDLERGSPSGRIFAAGLLLRKGRLHTRL